MHMITQIKLALGFIYFLAYFPTGFLRLFFVQSVQLVPTGFQLGVNMQYYAIHPLIAYDVTNAQVKSTVKSTFKYVEIAKTP